MPFTLSRAPDGSDPITTKQVKSSLKALKIRYAALCRPVLTLPSHGQILHLRLQQTGCMQPSAILLTTDSVGEKKEKMVVKEMDAVDVTLGSQDGLVHRKRDPFL